MQPLDIEALDNADLVLDRLREEWMTRAGVTAIDLGYKWSQGLMTPRLSIRVHVARKRPVRELSKHELFPRSVAGISIDVVEAAYALFPPSTEQSHSSISPSGAEAIGQSIPLGSSIGNQFVGAGTLGAKVRDLDSGDDMILSNWHVLAGDVNAKVGMPITHPGSLDEAGESETIAHLTRWLVGPYDAAVAEIQGEQTVAATTPDGREIVQVTQPVPGMKVWKFGRTTGLTRGVIDGTKGMVPLPYPQLGKTVTLHDVFRIVPESGDLEEISMPGDSGAVWVNEASGKAVGLHIAGEVGSEPEYALAHDIGAVMRALMVEMPAESREANITFSQPTPPVSKRLGMMKIIRALFALWRKLFDN